MISARATGLGLGGLIHILIPELGTVSWGLAGRTGLLSSAGLFHVSEALVLHVASLSMWCLTHQDLSPRDISF